MRRTIITGLAALLVSAGFTATADAKTIRIHKDRTFSAKFIQDHGVVADGTLPYQDHIVLDDDLPSVGGVKGDLVLIDGQIPNVQPASKYVLDARVSRARGARRSKLRQVRSSVLAHRRAEAKGHNTRVAFLGWYLNFDPALMQEVAFGLDLHSFLFGGNAQQAGGYMDRGIAGYEDDVRTEGEWNTTNAYNYCTWDEHTVGITASHFIAASGSCISGAISTQWRTIGYGSPQEFYDLFHTTEPDGYSPEYPGGGS